MKKIVLTITAISFLASSSVAMSDNSPPPGFSSWGEYRYAQSCNSNYPPPECGSPNSDNDMGLMGWAIAAGVLYILGEAAESSKQKKSKNR